MKNESLKAAIFRFALRTPEPLFMNCVSAFQRHPACRVILVSMTVLAVLIMTGHDFLIPCPSTYCKCNSMYRDLTETFQTDLVCWCPRPVSGYIFHTRFEVHLSNEASTPGHPRLSPHHQRRRDFFLKGRMLRRLTGSVREKQRPSPCCARTG